MVDKKSRIKLVLQIAEELSSPNLARDHANIILNTYGVQTLDPEPLGLSPAETVNTASDEQLLELASHFELSTSELPAPIASMTTTVKSAEPLFLFASHLTVNKVLVGDVSQHLETYGITLFVAHESIDVDSEWQTEIEKALDRADAGLVFLHKGFKDSPWCDQEVGWLLGRHIPVMGFSFDAPPHGFFGKIQAQPAGTRTSIELAAEAVARIQNKPQLVSRLAASLVAAMAKSKSFADTESIWAYLSQLEILDGNQCAELLAACKDNSQINWARDRANGRREFPRSIVAFIRQQPGGSVVSADVDAYEKYLNKK
ncbi:toll/interleukin-1 receptor domain-containing protein [Rhodococcus fascians]|nr:toll/interleukin-1 receptor domain-containing protein [Rhodococcus fascians]MBY4434393.1 toll/interleukin-1 receptor domain-containing protein [Rhodococcus fascians]